MKNLFFCLLLMLSVKAIGQQVMTPELLWSLGRVNGAFVYENGKKIAYTVTVYNIESATGQTFLYSMISDGSNRQLINTNNISASAPFLNEKDQLYYLQNNQIMHTTGSPLNLPKDAFDPKFSKNGDVIWTQTVKVGRTSTDYYPEYTKSTARIYDDLMYRHWSSWGDGTYNHVFYGKKNADGTFTGKDLLMGLAYDAPTKPFGGSEDYIWSPDGKQILYVSKKKTGKEAAQSTNTDIYAYNIETEETVNLTEGMMGYDKNPAFSPDGKYLAWTSMPRDGYEADKNSLWIMDYQSGKKYNLTQKWDGTVDQFVWVGNGKFYFVAPEGGTVNLYELTYTANMDSKIRRITNEPRDFSHIVGVTADGQIISHSTDHNHANELVSVNPTTGKFSQLTHVNDDLYNSLSLGESKKEIIKTKDGQDMTCWVIYPPNFDPKKKYPALVYCQGGPQSALSQFYSFRWNFQLMAANGYVIIAPNRRGMPGYGQAWNEAISGDWGGKPIDDYLSAADYIAAKPFIDKGRIGAVGASYGGYSVYMLAGKHEKRFKTFIAHCGLFNLESWYGSTEEIFFADFDIKGNYWQKPTPKSYELHNPKNFVDKWDTPILVFEGEKDFRVPYEQGLEAYQAARLKGLKSRLVIYPDEGHWVTKPHNSLVWHHEFFRWLRETL